MRSRLGDSPSLSGGWENSCLWLPEDVALRFPIVGTESSRCSALNSLLFAPLCRGLLPGTGCAWPRL